MFDYRICTTDDIDQIVALEQAAIASLASPDLLRHNSRETLLGCLLCPHTTWGAFLGGELVAFAVLFVPETEQEDLSLSLTTVDSKRYEKKANYKLCIVSPRYRGNHLQQQLGERLEATARAQGITLLCSTVSPNNPASRRSLENLGYRKDCDLQKYGFPRQLFFKVL